MAVGGKLNELTGREWIKFTKSWFIHNPPRRRKDELLHPAKFPESLVAEFITFFTRPGAWVLDPFLGTGSTLVAAAACGRHAVGVELQQRYAEIARERAAGAVAAEVGPLHSVVLEGDARQLPQLLGQVDVPQFDFCITSPPYWNQLHRRTLRQRARSDGGLDTRYSEDDDDLGNIDGYDAFIVAQRQVFDLVYDLMAPGAYLTVITNNVYAAGRLYPLAFDTLRSLAERWVPKDERIWLQDDKRLLPLGVGSAWVGNRHHQYCLIFRKEPVRP
ncbi:MAG: DNA methyltransferase [Chloroflexota bacterium]